MESRYRPVFVYGTLMPGQDGYGEALERYVVAQAPAYWKDASLFLGPAYPMAIRSRGGSGVYGQVLLFEECMFEDILSGLDDYEGYFGEANDDNLYIRQLARVQVSPEPDSEWEGPTRDVLVYVYVATSKGLERNRSQMVLSPSGDWKNRSKEYVFEDSKQIDALADEDIDSDIEVRCEDGHCKIIYK